MIVEFHESHIEKISLRKIDIEDLGKTLDAKVKLFKKNESYSFIKNNQIVACFGAVKNDKMGCMAVWIIGSTILKNYKKEFVSNIKTHIQRLSRSYDLITLVHENHESSHKWLSFLGFEKLHSIKCPDGINRILYRRPYGC